MKKNAQQFISTISSHKIIETILMIHTKKMNIFCFLYLIYITISTFSRRHYNYPFCIAEIHLLLIYYLSLGVRLSFIPFVCLPSHSLVGSFVRSYCSRSKLFIKCFSIEKLINTHSQALWSQLPFCASKLDESIETI